jgi:hypothetical protein
MQAGAYQLLDTAHLAVPKSSPEHLGEHLTCVNRQPTLAALLDNLVVVVAELQLLDVDVCFLSKVFLPSSHSIVFWY